MKRGIVVQVTTYGVLGIHNLSNDTYHLFQINLLLTAAFPQGIQKATEILFEADAEGNPLHIIPYNRDLDLERLNMDRKLKSLYYQEMRPSNWIDSFPRI